MRKTAAFCLVVAVLLAGATGPGLALQGGPPGHANDDGNGLPDHANAGGAIGGGNDGGDDDRPPGDDERDDAGNGDGTTESDGDAGDGDEDDGGVLSVVDDAVGGDEDDATPTATDRATPTESDDSGTPTNPVQPVLDIFETPEDTPEPTTRETPERTDRPSDEGRDQLPDPRETETPSPTEEPTATPRETQEETPEPTNGPSSESDGADDGNGDDGSADDGGGSILGSDDEPTATPTPSEPSIEYGDSGDATRVSISDVRAGRTVEVPLRGPATDGDGVAVEAVDVGVETGEPFTLTVTRPTADGGEEPAPGVPVGYFEVGTDHGAIGNATLTVSVDESALPAGVAPEDLEALRYADGEWRSTETTYDESAGVYTAETAGFSQFALAAPDDGPLEVTDIAVDEGAGGNRSGDGAATVHATVENTVDRQATGTVAITVDGETVGTRELTLGGGETATVSFDLPAERADGETVAVDGVESERLQVRETESEPATSSINGNLAFGVGAAAFLVLSAVGTVLLAACGDEWDWQR